MHPTRSLGAIAHIKRNRAFRGVLLLQTVRTRHDGIEAYRKKLRTKENQRRQKK